jgi:solute:Na+ symporter, SSS family
MHLSRFPRLALLAFLVGVASLPGRETWSELPALPDPWGYAGVYAGVVNGALVVAGGANFPEGMPWEGGLKQWHRDVYMLDAPTGEWRRAGDLPQELGYGGTAVLGDSLLLIGGSDADRHHASVWRLRVHGADLAYERMPDLPAAVANFAMVQMGPMVYILGGAQTPDGDTAEPIFWALNTARPNLTWEVLEPWPGPGRIFPVAGVQDGALYVMSGAELYRGEGGNVQRRYLRDAYRYRPGSGWSRIADLPRAAVAAPTPAPALGQSTLLVMGGDDGSHVGFSPMSEHPGFPRDVLAYHTLTDTWREAGAMPASHVTTPVVTWRGTYVIPSGEIRPGVRSPAVLALKSERQAANFGWINTTVVLAYLLGMVGIGFACSRRNHTTDDFFRGGQTIPWWAAGLSIFATMLSSITFMAIPAAAYMGAWTLFLANSYILIMPLVVFAYLPFYRRLNVTSAYEYLELRFNLGTRLAGAVLFSIYQCGRIAVVLYLPALAISTISNLDIHTIIVLTGMLCIVYTVTGGIAAVIWTDVVQAVVLVGGALLSLFYLWGAISGGGWEVFRVAQAEDKLFGAVTWSWDLTIASGWVILIGSLFHNLFPYTASQDVVQRYVTTDSEAKAARSIWLNALLSVPAQGIFFAIGTALFVFYRQQPARLDAHLQHDAIFPYYIITELPVGVVGLLIAGILAASQSTLSSSMNSIAACYVTDFHRRLLPALSESTYLRMARLVTIIAGVFGTAVALLMASADIRSIYVMFLEFIGLAGGTLSGLFVLGIFTRRATGRGAVLGALVSVALVIGVRYNSPVNTFAYAMLGLFSCVAVGWLSSVLWTSGARKPQEGLTIYSLRKP